MGDIVEGVVSWVREQVDRSAAVDGTVAETSGFDSAIHLVRLRGDRLPAEWRSPLVLRVKPSVERLAEADREAETQGWVAAQGFPTPRVLAVVPPGEHVALPVQVMERAPGRPVVDEVKRRPWSARHHVTTLAELQARLHGLDPTGFPPGPDLLDRRLGLPRGLLAAQHDDELAEGLAGVERLADRLRDAPPAVCHGDFHPLNALVDGDRVSIIDWTDAGVGDRHGDVARTLLLFELAGVLATNPLERSVLRATGPRLARRYRRAYTRHLPLDEDRLRLWAPVHLLHAWSQARWAASPAPAEELKRRFDAALDEVS